MNASSGTQRALPAALSEMAVALRAEIESLLLDDPRGVFLEAMKDAASAVNRFVELGTTDEGIGALADLRAALAIASEAIPLSADASTAEVLDESIVWLERLRRMAIERVALVEHTGLALPPVASHGTPVVHLAGEVAPPETLAKVEPWTLTPDVSALLKETEQAGPRPIRRDPEKLSLQIEGLARDAMEDLAIMGSLRLLREEEPWADCRGFEQRLLANLDALWSLDRPVDPASPRLDVPASLFRYATEWSSPDWGRSFAFAFGLGCCDSEVALRWVFLALRRADPRVIDAFAHAFALASSPKLDRAILEFLRSDASPEAIVVALTAAKRRRLFAAGDVLPLLAHPDERVVLAVVRCLSNAPRPAALAVLGDLSSTANRSIALAALEERCLLGGGYDGMRTLLSEAASGVASPEEGIAALRVLALVGEPRDADAVLAAGLAFEEGLEWLGWFGSLTHVEPLLRVLEAARTKGPAGTRRAKIAEEAIARVTGLDATRAVAETRIDLLSLLERVTAKRVRGGQPYAARRVLAELSDPKVRHRDRRTLALELAILGPLDARVDVDNWFALQAAQLACSSLINGPGG